MRKKTNIILCLAAAAVFAFSTVGTTLAAWKAVDNSDHVINTALVKGQIVEKYNGGEGLYPGNTVEKIVNVINTGTADSIVRVKVEKAWGETRDEDGNLAINEELSTDNILIDYNTEYWTYDKNDGYFYYKGALKPGETTVQPLFKEYKIDKDTGVEYSGMTADILVKMECVQAAYDGVSIWNKTYTELGFTYTESEKPSMVTKVDFVNSTEGFRFTPTDEKTNNVSVQDLFYNFKNLLPGETRSQTIEITNRFSEKTEIFLRAEDITQSLSPEHAELVTKLLREYATIVVTDDSGKVIYSGPIWGNISGSGSNPDTMKNNISLGVFSAGQTKGLNVQLQIDPQMGNEYADLWGLIRWVWSANGIDTPVKPPQTGDNSNLWLYGGLMAVSGVMLTAFVVLGHKKKKENIPA